MYQPRAANDGLTRRPHTARAPFGSTLVRCVCACVGSRRVIASGDNPESLCLWEVHVAASDWYLTFWFVGANQTVTNRTYFAMLRFALQNLQKL